MAQAHTMRLAKHTATTAWASWLSFSKNYARARRFLTESLRVNRVSGNRAWEAGNLNNLGEVARREGDYDSATTTIPKVLRFTVPPVTRTALL
jgi:hypothetical protein